jgi:uncharacterized membrane protein YbhN (UPF0104 family)
MPAALHMRRMLRWFGAGIVALSLYYVGRSLLGHFDDILALEWGRRAIAVTLAGTVVYTFSLVALAASWTVIAITALPDGRQLAIATRIYARSGIAKYLPGNIFHLVGRQLLGRALGVSQARLAVATATEIALSLLSVWLVAAAVFAAVPGPISRGLSLLAFVLGALAAIALVSPNLRWMVPRTAPVLDRVVGDARGPEFGVALALNLSFFLCLALIAGSVFRALTGEPLPLMQVGAVYLSAWLAGYIVPGASGGLGVREAALLVLMDGAAGQPAVLAFALAMRVQSILGDLCFFAASYALPSAAPEAIPP